MNSLADTEKIRKINYTYNLKVEPSVKSRIVDNSGLWARNKYKPVKIEKT